MAPRSSTYKTLSVIKKLEILRQADEMNSDRKVAKLHQRDPKSLRTWRKQKEKLVQHHFTEKGNTRKALPKTVSTHRFPVMETLLSSWILEVRSLGYAVSMKSMCQMALNFLDDLDIPRENFKTSTG